MGDTGSLALGGAIAAVAILLKQNCLLVIIGGVFVNGNFIGYYSGYFVYINGETCL